MFNLKSNRTNQIAALPFSLANDSVTRVWFMGGLFMLAIMVILLPASYFDVRQMGGNWILAKPIKFSLALALHFFTLAFVAQQLSTNKRNGWGLRILAYAAIVSMLFEQIYITLQAARGSRSHYNFESEFSASMYQLMGLGAFTLVLASFVLGIMVWRHGDKNGSGLRLGSIIGLTVGSVLTLGFAGYMSNQPSPLVGDAVEGAKNMAVVGWASDRGDLRLAHFLATHIMQILPVLGLVADKVQSRYPTSFSPRKLVGITSIVLVLACGGLFYQALAGQPLF